MNIKKSRFYEFFLEEKTFKTWFINNPILNIEYFYININIFIFYIIKREFYFLNISNPMTYNVFYLYYLKGYKRTNVHVSICMFDSVVHCHIDYIFIYINIYI